jgi:hypothetical protein
MSDGPTTALARPTISKAKAKPSSPGFWNGITTASLPPLARNPGLYKVLAATFEDNNTKEALSTLSDLYSLGILSYGLRKMSTRTVRRMRPASDSLQHLAW